MPGEIRYEWPTSMAVSADPSRAALAKAFAATNHHGPDDWSHEGNITKLAKTAIVNAVKDRPAGGGSSVQITEPTISIITPTANSARIAPVTPDHSHSTATTANPSAVKNCVRKNRGCNSRPNSSGVGASSPSAKRKQNEVSTVGYFAMSAKSSDRVVALSLNPPRMALVVITLPILRTPRTAMQVCVASSTTATPRG